MTSIETENFDVTVTQTVHVVLKPQAFTPEFTKEFSETIFHADRLTDHAEHIGQLIARGLVSEVSEYTKPEHSEFVDGYGPIKEFVHEALIKDRETEIEVEQVFPAEA